jgi:hypothetical protein
MHGSDYDAPARSDKTWSMRPAEEWLTGMFGTIRGSSITSIAFKTSKARMYGPIGSGGGQPFSFEGLLLGFYGALDSGSLSGIGAWYTPTATFTPGPIMFPRSLERSPAYGNLTNVWTWDDVPDTSGAHHLCLLLYGGL